MEELVERIASVRRQVTPRTSYATAGTASSVAQLFCTRSNDSPEINERIAELKSSLRKSKEFNDVETNAIRDLEVNKVQNLIKGHVTLLFDTSSTSYPPSDGKNLADYLNSALYNLGTVLANRHTNLAFAIISKHSYKASFDVSLKVAAGSHVNMLEKESYGNYYVLIAYTSGISTASSMASSQLHSFSSSSRPAPPPRSFNGQPSVQSRMQFKYLWDGESSGVDNVDFGKRRVLHRLAEHPGRDKHGKETKRSEREWDQIITDLLARGCDDFGIYSALRKWYVGTSLEEEMNIQVSKAGGGAVSIDAKKGGGDTSGGESKGEGEEGGNGRALHLVKMTLDCLPPVTQRTKEINTLLDYGCAEGAITAQLCRELNLKTSHAFGADVRNLEPDGFTFLQLPAEGDHAPQPRAILPRIQNSAIDLITCAMVLHHVKFASEAVAELRRIIHPDGHLIVREHHCTTPVMGAFLDITHGLYSLAWSDPIEWPAFLDEYVASYRSREQWNALLEAEGFSLLQSNMASNGHAKRQYEAADRPNPKHGPYRNVIKAYYAVYNPKPGFSIKDAQHQKAGSGGDAGGGGGGRVAGGGSEDRGDNRPLKRPRDESNQDTPLQQPQKPQSGISSNACDVFESKKNRGCFYYLADTTVGGGNPNATWITLIDCHAAPSGKGFIDPISKQLRHVTKIHHATT